VLRPLIRIMLRQGVQYPALLELLKSEFVHIAEHEFILAGRPQTDSRISLLTGVHRKDVRRLRGAGNAELSQPSSVSLGGQIVAAWLATAELVDSRGRPRPLQRLKTAGERHSFEALVESVTKDIRPRVLLDEWIRLGVARIDADDRIVLNIAAFVPESGLEEKLYYFGQNAHDHLAAIAENLEGERSRFIERSVYYSRLTPETVQKLVAIAEREGMRGLQTVNRQAAAFKRAERGHPNAVHRVNFGIYFYSEAEVTEKQVAAKARSTTPNRRRSG